MKSLDEDEDSDHLLVVTEKSGSGKRKFPQSIPKDLRSIFQLPDVHFRAI